MFTSQNMANHKSVYSQIYNFTMLGLLARAGALQYKHVGPVPACTELISTGYKDTRKNSN